MNFLAHLYLSKPTPAAWMGNLLPDFCRGPAIAALPPEPADLHEGVRNHRRVDAFTDTHPLFHQSRLRLFEHHGRFSGILVDVLYDHILAREWDRYHPAPLPAFLARVHDGLRHGRDLAPPPVRPIFDRMCDQAWLGAYGTRDGLRLTLTRMSARFAQRFGREVDLASVVDRLDELDGGLREDFHAFFPQLIAYVRRRSTPQTVARGAGVVKMPTVSAASPGRSGDPRTRSPST